MSEGLARFNTLPVTEAREALYGCFANQHWADHLAVGRPYASLDQLMAAAEVAWSGLTPVDWFQAFAAHPRIGERGGHAPATSEREQEVAMHSSDETLSALRAENQTYEERFGHVFLISASGRTAQDILESLRRRMSNDPATELEVAAGEQRKITRHRLERLLTS